MSTASTPGTGSSGVSIAVSSPLSPVTEEGGWPAMIPIIPTTISDAGDRASLTSKLPDVNLETRIARYHAKAVETEELLHLLALDQGGEMSEDDLIEVSRGIVNLQINGIGKDELRMLEENGVTHGTSAQPLSHRLYGPQVVLSKVEETKRIRNKTPSNALVEGAERDYLAEALARARSWEDGELMKPKFHMTPHQLRSLEKILPASWDEFSRKCRKKSFRGCRKLTKVIPNQEEDEISRLIYGNWKA